MPNAHAVALTPEAQLELERTRPIDDRLHRELLLLTARLAGIQNTLEDRSRSHAERVSNAAVRIEIASHSLARIVELVTGGGR